MKMNLVAQASQFKFADIAYGDYYGHSDSNHELNQPIEVEACYAQVGRLPQYNRECKITFAI